MTDHPRADCPHDWQMESYGERYIALACARCGAKLVTLKWRSQPPQNPRPRLITLQPQV